AVCFSADDRIRRRRTHHHASHNGLAADDQVTFDRKDRMQKFKFSCVAASVHSFSIDGWHGAFVALILLPRKALQHAKVPIAFKIALLYVRYVLDPLLTELAAQFIFGDEFFL